ncbi:hypothetical protein LguiB_015058 [Lonicera macranthoides]
MAILVPCPSEETFGSTSIVVCFECLGDALTDMVKEISENFDYQKKFHFVHACEVKQVVSINKHLTTDRMEEVKYLHKIGTAEEIKVCSLHIRATVEGILSDPKHFGSQLVAKR